MHSFQAKAFWFSGAYVPGLKSGVIQLVAYLKLRGLLFLIQFLSTVIEGQDIQNQSGFAYKDRILFYNVENLFDVFNDSLTNDDEFTPEGERHWNNYRFYKKLNNLSKVIIGIGEWNPPSVIGFCEVENRFVLNKLIYETPLKNFDYKIIHFESPDRRGIDIAMLYRQSRFEPVYYCPVPIQFPDNPESKTRDILYVKGLLGGRDTVHFFVNHWPSRYGGYEASKPRRIFVASVLRHKVDSINAAVSNPNIIIMGDFNDEPGDESIRIELKARSDTAMLTSVELVNLMGLLKKNLSIGTNKYKAEWSMIDQFIVSGNLLHGINPIQVSKEGARIFQSSFLLEEDETHLGYKLNRTYIGPVYHGGFSDHLPVYLDIISQRR